MKYPKDWNEVVKEPSFLCQKGPGYECLASIQFSPPLALSNQFSDVDLIIATNPNGYSVSKWIEEYTPETLNDQKVSLSKDIKIGENEWTKVLTTMSSQNKRIAFSVAKNKNIYLLRIEISYKGMEGTENILNQMLSTFRFLPPQ